MIASILYERLQFTLRQAETCVLFIFPLVMVYRSVVCSAVPLTSLTSWHTNRKWMWWLPSSRYDATDQSSLSAWLSIAACMSWWRITSASLAMTLTLAYKRLWKKNTHLNVLYYNKQHFTSFVFDCMCSVKIRSAGSVYKSNMMFFLDFDAVCSK